MQERPADTIPGAPRQAAQPEPLLRQEELDSLPVQDSIQPARGQLPRPEQQQDTISPAPAIQPKRE